MTLIKVVVSASLFANSSFIPYVVLGEVVVVPQHGEEGRGGERLVQEGRQVGDDVNHDVVREVLLRHMCAIIPGEYEDV